MQFRAVSAAALLVFCALSQPVQGQVPGEPASENEVSQPSGATDTPTASAELAPDEAKASYILPALTVVELEIVDPASSRTSQIGDRIRIRTVEPLVLDGIVAIPAGTAGYAEVIQASKARMMGKAGELTLGLPFLELGGQRIGLKRMRYGPSSGHSATTETLVATALVGLPGLLISGGNIDIQGGTRAHAVVSAETRIAAIR